MSEKVVVPVVKLNLFSVKFLLMHFIAVPLLSILWLEHFCCFPHLVGNIIPVEPVCNRMWFHISQLLKLALAIHESVLLILLVNSFWCTSTPLRLMAAPLLVGNKFCSSRLFSTLLNLFQLFVGNIFSCVMLGLNGMFAFAGYARMHSRSFPTLFGSKYCRRIYLETFTLATVLWRGGREGRAPGSAHQVLTRKSTLPALLLLHHLESEVSE